MNDTPESAVAQGLLDKPWGSYRPGFLQQLLIGLTRATFLQRGDLRKYMTRLITGMGRPLDIEFRGLRFRIAGRHNLIEFGLLTRPSYNGSEIDFLAEGLGPDGVAVDIGCNIGLYTLPLAKVAGQVIAIDANPDMTRHVGFHAAANALANVHTIASAVGDTDGRVDLEIHKQDFAIVSVNAREDGALPMAPLAKLLSEAGVARVDALKIDIEGHEDAALVPYLKEATDAMRPNRIVIEFLPPDDYPGCAEIFRTLGYRLVGRTRNNSMYLRD